MEISDEMFLALLHSLSPVDKDAVYELMQNLSGQNGGVVTNAFSAEEIGLMMTSERDNQELREIHNKNYKEAEINYGIAQIGRQTDEGHGI